MRWGAEKRLEFIDFRLYWEGRINRKDITDFFGVSIPQASEDLRKYHEKAPGNMEYDKRGKFYYAAPRFMPVSTSSDAESYLSQLQMIAMRKGEQNGTVLGFIPKFDVIHPFARLVDPIILRELVKAIRAKKALEIEYQSMSRPEPAPRWIAPHALASDGLRWHVRAFCYVHEEFRDFVIGRMTKVLRGKPAETDPSRDVLWNKYIAVKIGPHPGLTDAQKRSIEKDYGMDNGIAEIRIRAAFYFYLEKRLGLQAGCEERSGIEQQIVILNREEVAAALAESK